MRVSRGILLSYLSMIFIFIVSLINSNNISKALIVSIISFAMIQGAFIICKNNVKNSLFFLLAFNIPMQLYIWLPKSSVYSVETADSFSFIFLDMIILMIFLYSSSVKNASRVPRSLLILSFLLLLVYILAAVVSINKGASLFAIIRLLKAIILCISIIKIYEDEAFYYFVKGLKASVLFQMLIGFLQFIKGDVLGLTFLGEGVLRSANGYEKGMSGTVGHPGDFALFLLFCLVIFLFNTKKNTVYVLLCVSGLVLSQSRTALVIMVVIFILHWFSSKDSKVTYRTIIGFFIMIFSTPVIVNIIELVISRFFNSDLTVQEGNRRFHYELALKLFSLKEHFAFGPNASLTASSIYFPYEFQRGVFYYVHPIHNAFLVYLIETGIVGLVLYIILNLICLLNAVLVFRNSNSARRSRIISFGVWILVMSAYSMTGWAGIKDKFFYLLWICVAFSIANLKKTRENR